MDSKLIFSLLSTVVGLIAYAIYMQDVFRGRTQPHIYTWLIWLITQGIAVAGLWYGGGGIGALSLTVGLVLLLIIFLMSFKRGTKNITKGDTFTLIAALAAVFVWWIFNSPVLAVVIVTFIDLGGYIPSIRKSYEEPWSESIPAWICFFACNALALAALQHYNWLTVIYIAATGSANLVLLLVCSIRRKTISEP